MVGGGGGGGGDGWVGGRQKKKPPTQNEAFSIANGKVDDNMTIVL